MILPSPVKFQLQMDSFCCRVLLFFFFYLSRQRHRNKPRLSVGIELLISSRMNASREFLLVEYARDSTRSFLLSRLVCGTFVTRRILEGSFLRSLDACIIQLYIGWNIKIFIRFFVHNFDSTSSSSSSVLIQSFGREITPEQSRCICMQFVSARHTDPTALHLPENLFF